MMIIKNAIIMHTFCAFFLGGPIPVFHKQSLLFDLLLWEFFKIMLAEKIDKEKEEEEIEDWW